MGVLEEGVFVPEQVYISTCSTFRYSTTRAGIVKKGPVDLNGRMAFFSGVRLGLGGYGGPEVRTVSVSYSVAGVTRTASFEVQIRDELAVY